MKKAIRHNNYFVAFLKNSPVALILFIETILGIILTSGFITLFIKMRGEVLEKEFLPFDIQILHFSYTLRNPLLNSIMIDISYLGGEAMVVLGICITIFLFIKKYRREAMLFAFIFGMAAVINTILKDLVSRPRPQYHPLVVETGYSFPSGHAMDSIVFYLTISYICYQVFKNRIISFIVLLVSLTLIILIGISRVYLGVHYPTDVLAGYVGGLSWFISVLVIQKTLLFFKLFNEAKTKKNSIYT